MLLQIAGKEHPRLLQRYGKLPDSKLDKIESLADEYLSGTVKSSALPLLGGVGIGLYIGSISVPIVGAIAGSGLIYGAISSAVQKGKNAEYIKDAGVLAPFLRESDLVTYADLVGLESVMAEINQAYRDKQQVSPAARRLMRQMEQPLQRRTIVRYVSDLQASQPSENPSPTIAHPQTSPPAQSHPIEQDQAAHPLISHDVVDVPAGLAARFRSSVITARPRVGKSLIISHAMARLKADGVSIWVIQPKPSLKELGYWKHADRFLGFWAEKCPQDDEATIVKMNQFIEEWRAQAHRPTLLFIDEGLMLEAKFPKWFKADLKAQIVVEGSSGETDDRVLWIATQSPLVTDLGLTTGKRSAFDLVTLQKADTSDHAAMIRSSYKSIKGLPDRADFAAAPVGIMVYHNAVAMWCAVGQLPVPSIEPGDELCPELAAMARPQYSVVTSAPNIEPSSIDDELPELYEAIARLTVAQTFNNQDELNTQFKAVWDWAARRGKPFDKRTLQQAKITALKGLNADDLQALIELMSEEFYLTNQGDYFAANMGKRPC